MKGRQKPWIKFDGTGQSLHAFSTVALMSRGVPLAVKTEDSVKDDEMAKPREDLGAAPAKEAGQNAQAKLGAEMITDALNRYMEEYSRLPVGNSVAITSILIGEEARQIPRRIQYLRSDSIPRNGAGDLLAPWGYPFQIILDPEYIEPPLARSLGPNRQDEQGSGDDISHQQQ